MTHLDDMALFVEVVKVKSFRRAAEILGMPNSTLSRRISELEKAIGLRLLHRTTRKIELTEAGQIYYERSKRIVEEARLAHEQLGEMLAQPSGVLRASFPVDFATTYLAQLIADFAQLYPKISFDFDLTPRRVDLISEPYDVAIRIGPQSDSGLIARKLAMVVPQLYAAPGYLQRSGNPAQPSDLVGHQCLGFAHEMPWILDSGTETIEVTVGSRFRLNSVGMTRKLAALDQGIVLLPEGIVADEVAAGNLRRILPEWRGQPVPVYALTETRLLPAKTQHFIDFLRDRLPG